MSQGVHTPFNFKLLNSTSSEIILQKITTSCNCTVLDTLPEKISSKDSIIITGMLSSIKQIGYFGSVITIYYRYANTQEIRTVVVNVGATSLVGALANESFVNFGSIKLGSTQIIKSITILRESPKVPWSNLEIKSKYLEHKITRINKNKFHVDLSFDPAKHSKIGLVKEGVTVILLDSKNVALPQHSIKILTQAKIFDPDVDVSPASIYLSLLKKGYTSRNNIQIILKNNWAVSKNPITLIQSENKDLLQISTSVNTHNGEVTIICNITGKKEGNIEATLLVPLYKKDNPAIVTVIQIPIIGFIGL